MIIRTIAVVTLALVAAASTGCSNNDSRADNNTNMSADAKAAYNKTCPVCGMNADARYTVRQDGKSANCCSQACCDKFNGSSAADKQAMMNKAWSSRSRSSTNADDYNNQYAMENKKCPMSGHAANGKYVVDVDGHRTGFCSQECADQYRAMSPEHRAEVRAKQPPQQ